MEVQQTSLIDPWILIAFIVIYLLFNLGLGRMFANNMNKTKTQFLVANRDLNQWQASFAVAASYLWAPAFFITATLAYTQGWQGVMYFLLGNGLALCFFGMVVNRVCEKWPNGFTITDVFRQQYSDRVQMLYWFTSVGLMVGAFATQIYAGAKFMTLLSGLDFTLATVILASVPLCYSIVFGFKSSVINGLVKIMLCLVVSLTFAALTLDKVGIDTVVAGMSGITGDQGHLLSEQGWLIFSTFGLATLIGLFGGPFGDQSLWQRAFATPDPAYRRRSFMWAAVLFLVTPAAMAVLGFAAAGLALPVSDPGFVNLELVITQFGMILVMLFAFMILAGVTMDSHLNAISAVAGHDFARRIWAKPTDRQSILIGRTSMVLLAVLAVAVANIPEITLIYLFLIYNTLRSSTLIPTITFIFARHALSEQGVFWGIMTSLVMGLPLLIYGALNTLSWATLAGSVITVTASGVVAWTITWIGAKRQRYREEPTQRIHY